MIILGVSRDNVIPLFIRGSEHDPRTKTPVADEHVPNRPIGHRPEPQVTDFLDMVSSFLPSVSSNSATEMF